MSVSVTDNTGRVLADIKSKVPIALRLMLDAVDSTSEPRTPKDEGDLRANKLKQVLGTHALIQWRQKYAAVQEDNQFKHYTTPGTGPHYAEDAVKTVVADGERYFKRAGL